MRGRALAALALAAWLPLAAHAADDALERVRDRIAKLLPEVPRENITRSPADGLFEVRSGIRFAYVTADGRFLVSGDMVDLDSGEAITEAHRNQQRLDVVATRRDDAIAFSFGTPREWVTVFTDVECHYCQLLHREIPEITRAGIGVRYLFFSKYGAPSQAYDEAQSVWCQGDRLDALNKALLKRELPKTTVCRNPVGDHYATAAQLGVRGTPATILPDGSLFYGYVKAQEFVERVAAHSAMPSSGEATQSP